MTTSMAERTIIIRGAESIYRSIHPEALVFSKNIQVTWITDSNVILGIITIDVNRTWGMDVIESLERSVNDYIVFLKLFGFCLLVTFRDVESEFNSATLDSDKESKRNPIHSGINLQDPHSRSWRDVIMRSRNFRAPKWINTL